MSEKTSTLPVRPPPRWRIACILALLIAGCTDRGPGSLEHIRETGRLTVVVRNAPTSWYIGPDDAPTGPSFDLVSAFAGSLGVEAEFVVEDTTQAVLDAIASGRGDLAAAGLTATEARSEAFLLGPGGLEVREQVVCHRDGPQPAGPAELDTVQLVVTAGSSYVDTLERLSAEHPAINYQTSAQSTEQLLERVYERSIDCTVADSHIVAINRRYFPELTVEFDLSEARELVWVMPRGADELASEVRSWLASPEAAEVLAAVQERYFSFVDLYDYVDLREFLRRIDSRYPSLASLFAASAAEHDLDPILLAAQAYQESHWNPKARSPTGVRGIMMLTLPTAKAMGVASRLDPAQSIRGGARYLERMRERVGADVAEPDRTYLALAAYNVGFAHLRDAQSLAELRGLDPTSWADVRSVLPLLSDPDVYKDLPYGYARGREPVRYVERIRNYADVLAAKLAAPDVAESAATIEAPDAGVTKDER